MDPRLKEKLEHVETLSIEGLEEIQASLLSEADDAIKMANHYIGMAETISRIIDNMKVEQSHAV